MNDRLARRLEPAIVLAAAALAAGPLLFRRGFVLVGDMSFVPDLPWKPAWLGLDGSAPRAVPADAFVAVLGQVIPGELLQRLVLVGALVIAGLGAARLAREVLGVRSHAAAAAAGVLYLWNPYVLERLAIGHWGLLLGYAALPWVVLTATARRREEPGSTARLCLALALAAVGSPSGGMLAAGIAVIFLLGQVRRVAVVLVLAVLVNLPWLVPGIAGADASTDPHGVDAFAARADGPFGLLGSALTLGGIWKQSVVPGERDSWFLVALALVAALASVVVLLRRGGSTWRFLVAGGLGLLLAVLPGTGPGADLTRALVEHVPGGGLLRDSQKWLAPLALAVVAGFAVLVEQIAAGVRRLRLPARPFQLALIALPVIVLPSMAWGLAGDLDPVRYPPDWSRVQSVLEDQPADQRRTVVLPFSAYQSYRWNDGRAALDPALRFLPGQVVTNDELAVEDHRVVAGDNPDAARIARAVSAGEPLAPVLADLGVRFVLVEKTAAGAEQVTAPPGATVYDGRDLRLIDLGGRADLAHADHPGWIVAGDVLAGLTVLISIAFVSLRQIRRRRDEIG